MFLNNTITHENLTMNLKFKYIALVSASVLSLIATPATATVMNASDVTFGGTTYTTFKDNSTQRLWLDISNFYSMNYSEIMNVLSGTGFHLATFDDIQSIAAIAPLDIAGYKQMYMTVGGSPIGNISIIDGIYDGGNIGQSISEFYVYEPENGNSYTWTSSNQIDINRKDTYRGAWVVQNATVSEPAHLALLGLGLMGIGFMRKRKA